MKRSFLILLLAASVAGLHAQNSQLNLHIEGFASKPVLVEQITDKVTQLYSGPTDAQGRISIPLTLSVPGFYRINLDQGKETFFLVMGPGDKITLTSKMDQLYKEMKVKGSDLNAQYLKVKYLNDSIKSMQARLEQEHKNLLATPGNDALLNEIVTKHTQLQNERLAVIKKFMEDHSSTLAVLFFTEEVKQENEPELYDKIVDNLMKKYPENYFVQDINRKVTVERRTRIGSVAPDIALPNPSGDTIRLSSLRGKVVLLDFWAAWCGPCRRENPNIVRIYNQYKDKGFEIYGVSLDRDKASWLRGIQEDKLTWTLVSDLKYWSSPAAQLYGVTSIPYAILLDKEGKIIAKKIRSHDLERILAEMFPE